MSVWQVKGVLTLALGSTVLNSVLIRSLPVDREFAVWRQIGDIAPLSSAAAILFGAAILACYIPARRATHIEPTVALRYE